MVNNDRIFRYKWWETALEVNFTILKTMFNPFPFIFVILELKFFLTVAHWGHEAKHKFLKKMLHIGDNVAHWGVAHWVHPVYLLFPRKYAINTDRKYKAVNGVKQLAIIFLCDRLFVCCR